MNARRVLTYAGLVLAALIMLVPLYVMVITSFKTLPDIRAGNVFQLPLLWTAEPWIKAWSSACIGIACNGIGAGFWKSVEITIPSALLSILVGALTGYTLALWRPKGGGFFYGALLLGAFLPGQVFVFPLLVMYMSVGLQSSLAAVVISHVVFNLPIQTVLFRNFYASLPVELFKAARVDGAGYFNIFAFILLPMSLPMVAVAGILVVTGVWNDYLIGAVFGGLNNRPMTVLLKNLVAPEGSQLEYNVNMAATLLTAAVPILIYFAAGRLFVRGISEGAVKG